MWSVECGAQSVKCTVLSVKCEAWSVECKVWSVQCEVWSVRCRVGSVKCRVPVVLHCQLPNCLLRLAGGSRLAHLGSKDAAAAPKHHGSEGRIGPAASSPECQTSLSERLETSYNYKPGLYLSFCTASFQIACCVLQEAFVWHTSATSVPRTLPQHQNTMAVKDGSGPQPAAQGAKHCFLNCLEASFKPNMSFPIA